MNDEKNTAYNSEMTQESDYFFDGQRTRLDTRICDYIMANPSEVPAQLEVLRRQKRRKSVGVGIARAVLVGFCGWFCWGHVGNLIAHRMLVMEIIGVFACALTIAWTIQDAVEGR